MFSFRLPTSASGLLGVLALGLANSGCSFIFVTPPPAHAEQASHRNADCSTSRAAPIIDGIIAGYQVVRTVYATQAPDSTYQGDAPLSRGADIGLGLGFAGLFLASTIYGAVNTSACRDFKARADEADRAEERERSARPARPRRAPKPEPDDAEEPAVDEPGTPAVAPTDSTPLPPPSAAPPAPPTAPPGAAPSPFTSVPKANSAFPP